MTNDERYIVEALTDYNLTEDEQRFIDFWIVAEHQEMTVDNHRKLMNMYEKYIGLGIEGNYNE